ncbi:Monocarboxylate transporter 14 [Dufourea novaeangliae]|uniref:Monocarboxylate transporter 14 n=1 Tax=Dufourea novaeangliae TaxID=178035 RepID=A0A154PJ23_DUFNO|nr:Monocarboxylate transporter 14 [Dufourea novaeangliae]
MLIDDRGSGMGWTSASVRGGWSTPGGCRNSAMSFGGSVPSLHPTGSIRSLRSQHSMQGMPDTPRRCMHCHPVHVPSTPNNYIHHPMQYYTPSHCREPRSNVYIPHRGSSYHGDIDDAGMRTHFYPDGGWGWLVCAAGFLALLLTTGMQLAFGLLHVHAARHFGEEHLMDLVNQTDSQDKQRLRIHGDLCSPRKQQNLSSELLTPVAHGESLWRNIVRGNASPGSIVICLTLGTRCAGWQGQYITSWLRKEAEAFGDFRFGDAESLDDAPNGTLVYVPRSNYRINVLAWAGALSAAVSRGSAPLVVCACRRGNTRLTAVIGGLVLALASLVTSFAVELHQVLLSYGLVLGTGAGLVRETAGVVLGHYFRKRREFVEMVVQSGAGVGIVLFSVFYREAVGKLGWKRGMQSVTGALSLAFFLGLIYKSASIYHPQRRAMLHLKNQRGKVKEKRTKVPPKQPWVDLSPLGSRPVRMLMLAAGAAGFGLYTPAFYIVSTFMIQGLLFERPKSNSVDHLTAGGAVHGHEDGLEASAVVLLQTCLGLAAALGCAAWGVVTARPSAQCLVSRQYLCQAALLGVAVAQVALGSVQGYHGLVLASGLYGASLGGALYSLKMLALERLRARHFARAWALVQAAEALPILLGVPLTGYMNAYIPRVGYYACTLSSLCGAALLFLVGSGQQPSSPILPDSHLSTTAVPPPRTYPPPPRPRLPKSQSLHVPLDIDENLRERDMDRMHTAENYYQPQFYGPPLRPSKSVPEGLSHQNSYRNRPRRHRDVTVIEQITTSV